jgi:hypothetical protein
MTFTKEIKEWFNKAEYAIQKARRAFDSNAAWNKIESDWGTQSDILVAVLGVRVWAEMLADKLARLTGEVRQ